MGDALKDCQRPAVTSVTEIVRDRREFVPTISAVYLSERVCAQPRRYLLRIYLTVRLRRRAAK